MPRTMTAVALVLTAFGMGYGARTVIALRQAAPAADMTAPAPPSASAASETLEVETAIDPRPDPLLPESRGLAANPAPVPPAIIPIIAAARTGPASGPASGPATLPQAASSSNSAALAYAPALPDVPNPFPVLASLRLASQNEAVPAPDLAPFPPADHFAAREAIAAYQKGDIAGGDAAARRITDKAARTAVEWFIVRSGNRSVSHNRVVAFLQANPDWPTRNLLMRRAEEALVADVKSPGLIRTFFAERAPVTAMGRIILARALVADGKKSEAEAMIRTVWRTDHFSDETEESVLKDFGNVITRDDHRARMERYIFKSMWAKATRAAARAGADYAAIVKARQALDNETPNAKALIAAIPASVANDTSAIFARAQLARRGNDATGAAKMIEKLTRDPAILADGDEWWVERRMITRKLLDAGEPALAYAVAAGHGAASPAMQVEAEFHAGWIALRFLNDGKKAEPHFRLAQQAARMPMSQARAAYWLGRAARHNNEPAQAKAHFEEAARHSAFFYGQLARAELGLADMPAQLPALTPEERTLIAQDAELRAVDLLLSLGERDAAMVMISDMAQTSGTDLQLHALGLMLAARHDTRGQLVLGKLALQRGVMLKYHAFPTAGIPDFQHLMAPVEKPIVHSIARQESAFNPRAVSHAGAMGLMQLMPGTARVTASRAKTNYDQARLLSDPAYNAQIGAAHLSELVEAWRGSYILTFAAYNAGGGNVKKWIDAYGDPRQPHVDPVDWIERIPFTETRNYVQRIMENLQVYRARFEPGTPLRIETDLRRGARHDLAQGP
ncbi:MAG: lytic transglycosylase domain-containing protein [Beijerinckiaceae bacterium]